MPDTTLSKIAEIHRPSTDHGPNYEPYCVGCWEAGGEDGAPLYPCPTLRAVQPAAMPEGVCDDCYLDHHANCIGTYVADSGSTVKCVCEACETEACERCMGVGTVEKTVGIQWLEVDCSECDGTGRRATR